MPFLLPLIYDAMSSHHHFLGEKKVFVMSLCQTTISVVERFRRYMRMVWIALVV